MLRCAHLIIPSTWWLFLQDGGESSIDAHLITFSVEDRASFRFAEARLREVRCREDPPGGSIVILVANKEDLVRSRDISEEGKMSKMSGKYKDVLIRQLERVI